MSNIHSGGKYRTFHTTVALNHEARAKRGRPVEFRVLGDGKLLWASYPIYHSGNGEPCMLDITGVDVLRLEVRFVPETSGDETRRDAVWGDPYVSETAVSASELALYSPKAYARWTAILAATNKVRLAFDAERFAEIDALMKEWRSKVGTYQAAIALEQSYAFFSQPADGTEAGWAKHFARLERWKAAEPREITPLWRGRLIYRLCLGRPRHGRCATGAQGGHGEIRGTPQEGA